MNARQKVLDLDQLAETVRGLQKSGRVVAQCHGCFDILHAGHLTGSPSAWEPTNR